MPDTKSTRHRGFRVDGPTLEREMLARGLTGQQLAKAAGCSNTAVARARRGLPIDRSALYQIARALDDIPANPTFVKLSGGAA